MYKCLNWTSFNCLHCINYSPYKYYDSPFKRHLMTEWTFVAWKGRSSRIPNTESNTKKRHKSEIEIKSWPAECLCHTGVFDVLVSCEALDEDCDHLERDVLHQACQSNGGFKGSIWNTVNTYYNTQIIINTCLPGQTLISKHNLCITGCHTIEFRAPSSGVWEKIFLM